MVEGGLLDQILSSKQGDGKKSTGTMTISVRNTWDKGWETSGFSHLGSSGSYVAMSYKDKR